jgi:hypothetical protein
MQAKKWRENIVLSLNPDGQQLHGQESVLRENGFEIISAATPLQAVLRSRWAPARFF